MAHSSSSIVPYKAAIGAARLVAAAGIYVVLACYLFGPHLTDSGRVQYLLPVNVTVAGLGCFILSRRWVSSFAGSVFAGAVYGFGPFTLGLAGYHVSAGFPAAMVPWLFLPAAFGPKGKSRWLSVPLSAMPFAAVFLFFKIFQGYRLFPAPVQTKLQVQDLAGVLAPLVLAERGATLVGFYHVPTAALVMGLCMLLAAKRFGVVVIAGAGLVLSFYNPAAVVSPIVWLSFCCVCCSVIIGAGVQGLASAGRGDGRWILLAVAVETTLAIITLLLAAKYFQTFLGFGSKYAKLFVETARFYLLGAVTVGIVFFITRTKLRVHWLRVAVLSFALAFDIFLGARFIIDRVL